MINRIYFDTNILRTVQWPRLSSKLESVLGLARALVIDVLIPDAVEHELEAHWLREGNELSRKATSAISDLRKHISAVTSDRIELPLPERPRLLEEYRRKVQEVRLEWKIQSVPMTTRPLVDFFQMAITQRLPFKEKGAGFQDAVIYFSIIDHLRQTPDQVAAFVSNDNVFEKQETSELAASTGVRINVYKTIDEILRALEGGLGKVVETIWEQDRQRAKIALEAMVPKIQQFVFNNLLFTASQLRSIGLSKAQLNVSDSVVMVSSIEVKAIKDVWTTPPMKRQAGEAVKISFKAEMYLSVLVNRDPGSSLAGLLRVGEVDLPSVSLLGGPIPEDQVWQHEVEIEAAASVVDEEYRDVKLLSVELPNISPFGFGLAR